MIIADIEKIKLSNKSMQRTLDMHTQKSLQACQGSLISDVRLRKIKTQQGGVMLIRKIIWCMLIIPLLFVEHTHIFALQFCKLRVPINSSPRTQLLLDKENLTRMFSKYVDEFHADYIAIRLIEEFSQKEIAIAVKLIEGLLKKYYLNEPEFCQYTIAFIIRQTKGDNNLLEVLCNEGMLKLVAICREGL